MPAEVVGTAFVRIRALTKGLTKDIEKSVNKAFADADFTKVSDKFAQDFTDDASDKISKGLKESVENVKLDGSKAGDNLGQTFADSAGEKINKGLTSKLRGLNFDPELTRIGRASADRINKTFNDRVQLGKDKHIDPQFVRNISTDFQNLFAQDDPEVGNSLTRFFGRIFDRLTPDIRRRSGAAGRDGGKSFGDRFVASLKTGLARLATILTPSLATLVSFAVQYVTALVAQVSLLIEAAAGGAVALGAAGAAVGLAILPLVAAFKVDTKRLQNFKKIGESVGKAWREFGIETQRTLLPALGDSLKMTKRLIPVFSDYGAAIGEVIGEHVKLAAGVITGTEGQERFRKIFEGSVPIVEDFMKILIDLGDIASNLFIDALPVAQQFSDILQDMVGRWRLAIQAGTDDGSIAAMFQDWFDKSRLVFGALGDLTVAIGNIIAVGSDAAVPFFDNFAVWAQDFRTFTESAAGQNKLKQIFDDALTVAHAFNLLVVDIVRRIGGTVFEGGGVEGLVTFIDTLRLQVVPFLDSAIRPLLEDLGPQLFEFFYAFANLLTALGESGAIEVAVQALTLFTTAVVALMNIPGFDTLAGTIIGIAGAFGVLKLVLPGFVTGPIIRLLGFLGGVAWSAIAAGISAIGTAIAGASLATIGVVVAIIAAVIAAIVLLVIHWDKVKEAFAATKRFFADPMKRLEALKENLEDLAGVIGRALLGAAKKIPGRRVTVGKAIGTGLLTALRKLPGLLVELGGILIEVFRRAIVELIKFTPTLLGLWLDSILFFLIDLPLMLANLGLTLIQVFANAFAAVGRWLASTGIPAITDFFMDLPGTLLRFFNETLPNALFDAFMGAITFLVEELPGMGSAIIDFFKDLPGNLIEALGNFVEFLWPIFQRAMDKVKEKVGDRIDDIVDFFKNLPGRITAFIGTITTAALQVGAAIIGAIITGLSGAGEAIGGAAADLLDGIGNLIGNIKEGIGKAIDGMIPNRIPGVKWDPPVGPTVTLFPELNLPDNPLKDLGFYAHGGIFDDPTAGIFGEAGREVIIPLTQPERALQLARESGLLELLMRQQRRSSNNTHSTTAPVNGRDLTVIQNFHEKQDPKLMAAELAWQLP